MFQKLFGVHFRWIGVDIFAEVEGGGIELLINYWKALVVAKD